MQHIESKNKGRNLSRFMQFWEHDSRVFLQDWVVEKNREGHGSPLFVNF